MNALRAAVFLDSKHIQLEYEVKPGEQEDYRVIKQEILDLRMPIDFPARFIDSYVPQSALSGGGIALLATNYVIYREEGLLDEFVIYNRSGVEIYRESNNTWRINHISADVLRINEKTCVNLQSGEVTEQLQ
jgi:hypothetical protein